MRAWTQTFCGRVAVWGHAPPAKIRAPLLGLSTILSATKKPEEGTSEGNSVPNDDQVSNRAAIATLREVSRPLGKQKAEGHVATVRFFDVPSPPVDTFKLHISPPVAILGGYICGMVSERAMISYHQQRRNIG